MDLLIRELYKSTTLIITIGVLYVVKHRLIVYKKACPMTSFLPSFINIRSTSNFDDFY